MAKILSSAFPIHCRLFLTDNFELHFYAEPILRI